MKNLQAIPEGVRDIYGEELAAKKALTEKMLKVIRSFGYLEIEPPAFEYFDVFSGEVGTTPSRELYKFFDREGETLALRPDFTPSVVRHASGLSSIAGRNRLTYHGMTFINSSSLQGKSRQTTQLGAELFAEGSEYADAEILGLAALCLKEAGLRDFQISFGNADFFRGLCRAAGLSAEAEERLRGFVKAKNQVAVRGMLSELSLKEDYARILLKCTDLFGDFDSLKEAEELLPKEEKEGLDVSRRALKRLQRVYDLARPYGISEYLKLDLGLLSKYHYYTGLIFRGYTYGHGDAIATGGRYDSLCAVFGKEMPAIGFAIAVEDLLRALRFQGAALAGEENPESVCFSEKDYEKTLEQVMERRRNGEAVALERAE